MNSTRQSTLSHRASRIALLAAALTLPATLLPAQWSGNAKRNTFAGDCPVPPATIRRVLAIDPVLTPCDDGCFYAWIDAVNNINIQVIDSCGYRALSSPLQIARGFCGAVPLPAQIAGCQYDDPSTIAVETNQMFLAYTLCSGGIEQLWGSVFTFTGGALVPSTAPLLLHTCSTPFSIVTPVVDTSVTTFGENGAINGAAIGWREWDFVANTVTIQLGSVTAGTAAAPAMALGFPFPVTTYGLSGGVMPGRLSVISDHAGGVFAGWRGMNSSGNGYYQGTHVNSTGTLVLGWPTAQVPTTSTADDWAIASDLQGGAFTAVVDDARTLIRVDHATSAGVFSTSWIAATVGPLQSIHPLAMVGIAPPPGSAPGSTHAALAYRAHQSLMLVDVSDLALVITPGPSASLGTISGTTGAEGCAVLAHRGVAVGWVEYPGNSGDRFLYGQEVDVRTALWPTLWNSGNKLVVSKNDHLASAPPEGKFVPMVVRKHTLPEVIFGWVDTRTAANNQVTPGATAPGAYVQSVADDYVQLLGMGFKKTNGKLGSSILCALPKEHFDIHGFTLVISDPSDPVDPFGDIGQELFVLNRTDGTLELLQDINPGPAGSNPSRTEALGSRRIFAATTLAGGREPWVTDGTGAGTLQLADCAPGTGSSSPAILGMGQDGVECYFSATTASTGRELWRTDGTPAGTWMILDLLPGTGNGVVSGNHATSGGWFYFWGNDGVHGVELMRTDGSAAGTTIAVDLTPGSGSTSAGGIVALAGMIVFGAGANGLGSEPYALDPQSGTVTLLGDLAPGAASSGPSFLTAAAGAVWFSASDTAGRELWRTDGTPAGTFRVADIHPTGSSNPSVFTDAGSYLLFSANDGIHGEELWRTDGTAAGTMLVADVLPGTGSSNPTAITPIGGGRFVFTAADSGTDREPWVTDGTSQGTQRLADVNPGAAGSNPQTYDIVDGRLFFDAIRGGQPSTMQLELTAPATFGQGCGGAFGVPRIGATAPAVLGTTLDVTLAGAAPNSFAGLIFNATSQVASLGSCTLYVGLPELGIFLAPTDGAGNAVVSLAVPNDPALRNETFFFQWAVLEPTGPLLGLSLSNALRVVVE